MAFIPSHKKKHDTSSGRAQLQLTSMMDMFTIILVFLLKTYSTHGQLINPSRDLTLPKSVIQHPPETGLDVTVSADWIMVNDKPIIQTQSLGSMEGYLIEPVYQELQRYAREAQKMEELYGAKFSGKVTIQGDKDIPYQMLIKVMYTCGQSSYPNMRLVVYKKEG